MSVRSPNVIKHLICHNLFRNEFYMDQITYFIYADHRKCNDMIFFSLRCVRLSSKWMKCTLNCSKDICAASTQTLYILWTNISVAITNMAKRTYITFLNPFGIVRIIFLRNLFKNLIQKCNVANISLSTKNICNTEIQLNTIFARFIKNYFVTFYNI